MYEGVPREVLIELSPYNYIPTQWITILFVVLFGISTALHLGQAVHTRLWWLYPTILLAGLMETAGWAGRIWSSVNPPNGSAFQLQIVLTILAPTPLIAANFIILGRIVDVLGSTYSRLTPRQYSLVFLTADLVALVIQGVGGGIAASAETSSMARTGGNIMLGGIAFQFAMIILFTIAGAEFFWRFTKDIPFANRPTVQRGAFVKNLQLLSAGLGFSTLVLVIRAIYRLIELVDGWDGRIISTEVYFNVLDGGMIVLAMYTLNLCHPGYLLPSPSRPADLETAEKAKKLTATSTRSSGTAMTSV